jgi:hypothetical protein
VNNFETYTKDHCWQYDIRLSNRKQDLINSGLIEEDVQDLRNSDFIFANENKDLVFNEVRTFIERHEWLGRLSLYPTHFFTARYKGILAGVVIMDMPSAFSKILGEDTRKLERLISRGACISWSPKNLASALIMFSIKWMVKNTRFRLFTAYSDSEAKELGTIYQACSFYYLGKKSGSGYQYKTEADRWVSDRYFRSRSVYKKLAKKLGITWDMNWQDGDVIHFDKMPEDVANLIKTASKDYQNSCEKRKIESKHKYAFVLGATKYETKQLRKIYEERNKLFAYPKERGK